jgi:glycolate oxidase FAD binding subunit
VTTATSQIAPESPEAAAELLRDAGGPVRIAGAGTKRTWGNHARTEAAPRILSTEKLNQVIEHNAGDLTAVVQAGVPIARLREQLAEHSQMLALDPPSEDATIGGIVATGDSGPLRHRYGGPRDLVLGVSIALPDGTVAKAGGKVIKNVAGYDLAKLMTGAFGTLGLIAQVALRLHPIPRNEVTVVGETDDPTDLAKAALAASHARLEAQSLDIDWRGDQGMVLMRFGGVAADKQATTAQKLLEEHGTQTSVLHDDTEVWKRQAARQRSENGGTVVRVSGTQTQLASLLGVASLSGATVVGRVALGLSWVCLPSTADSESIATMVRDMRRTLAPAACVVLDRADGVDIDPWGVEDGPELDLMRRTKQRFDPRGVCNPGIYVGGM